MWKFNKFCCCCNLRTGSLVVGIIETIFATLYLCVSFGNLVILQNSSIHEKIFAQELDMYMVLSYSMYYHFGYALICSVVHGMSIYGINKKKRIYILPYLVLNGMVLAILVTLLVMGIVFVAISWGSIYQNAALIITIILLCIIYGGIKTYFWTTVYFYYNEVVVQKTYRHSQLTDDSSEDANKYTISPQRLV